MRDKFTGAPRGFAFVQFNSVADAARALSDMNGQMLQGTNTPLRIHYAMDRPAGPVGGPPPGLIPGKAPPTAMEAIQAAEAMR